MVNKSMQKPEILANKGRVLALLPITDRLLVDVKIANKLGGGRTAKLRDIAKKVISERIGGIWADSNAQVASAYGIDIAKELPAAYLKTVEETVWAAQYPFEKLSPFIDISKYNVSGNPEIKAIVENTLHKEYDETMLKISNNDYSKLYDYKYASEILCNLEGKMRVMGNVDEARQAAKKAIYYMIIGGEVAPNTKDFLLNPDEKREATREGIKEVERLLDTNKRNIFTDHERKEVAKNLISVASLFQMPEVVCTAVKRLVQMNADKYEIDNAIKKILDLEMAGELKNDKTTLKCARKVASKWEHVHAANLLFAIGDYEKGMARFVEVLPKLAGEYSPLKDYHARTARYIEKKYDLHLDNDLKKAIEKAVMQIIYEDIKHYNYDSAKKLAQEFGFEEIAAQMSAIQMLLGKLGH